MTPPPIGGPVILPEVIEQTLLGPMTFVLSEEAQAAVAASAATIEDILRTGKTVYGVNTGFGLLAKQTIRPDQLVELQRNLILSHCCGVGDPLPDDVVRLVLLLKAAGLSRGLSGVRPELIAMLLRLLETNILPVIPAKGSVGASGDLAPLAHMVLPLLGLGEMDYQGRRMTAAKVLKVLGLKPLKLQSKEGLGLINGTQFMSAYAVLCLLRIQNVAKTADIAADNICPPGAVAR